MSKNIRVLNVDDSAFIRKLLKDILESDDDFDVVDQAKNGKEAIEKIKQNKVHYIVHEENLSQEMEDLYQKVKKELNLKEVSLSNLSSKPVTDKNKQKDYVSIMYENYNHLVNMVESK